MDKRLYRVSGMFADKGETLEFEVEIPMGDNIFVKTRDEADRVIGGQRFIFFGINSIIEISKCEGCQIEACGQMHHMVHPDGCLHVPSDCDLCQMEIKNLLKLSE